MLLAVCQRWLDCDSHRRSHVESTLSAGQHVLELFTAQQTTQNTCTQSITVEVTHTHTHTHTDTTAVALTKRWTRGSKLLETVNVIAQLSTKANVVSVNFAWHLCHGICTHSAWVKIYVCGYTLICMGAERCSKFTLCLQETFSCIYFEWPFLHPSIHPVFPWQRPSRDKKIRRQRLTGGEAEKRSLAVEEDLGAGWRQVGLREEEEVVGCWQRERKIAADKPARGYREERTVGNFQGGQKMQSGD